MAVPRAGAEGDTGWVSLFVLGLSQHTGHDGLWDPGSQAAKSCFKQGDPASPVSHGTK